PRRPLDDDGRLRLRNHRDNPVQPGHHGHVWSWCLLRRHYHHCGLRRAATPATWRRLPRAMSPLFAWPRQTCRVDSYHLPPRPASRGVVRVFPPTAEVCRMRQLLTAALAVALVVGFARAEDKPKEAPKEASKIVLQSPDGKKTYDLEKLTADG